MINKILNIAKLSQISQNSNVKSYNTTLPMLLSVIKKTNIGYLLKLGNNEIEARSAQNLTIGARYWAMVKDASGEILISHLIKQPKMLELAKDSPLKIDINDIEAIAKDSKWVKNLYENTLESALNAQNRDEFLFLANSLLAFNKKIINLVIKDSSKNIVLQMKKQGDDRVDFSAIFSNLGVINGILYNTSRLLLKVQYNNVKKILENNTKSLVGFSEVNIVFDDNIEILFDLCEESLLDLEA